MKTTILAVTAVMALAYAACGDGIYGNQNAHGDGTANAYDTGGYNTGYGYQAFYSLTSGSYNTANGPYSLFNNTTGNSNIALGSDAGALLITGDNNIDIGNQSVASEGSTIRIGTEGVHSNTFIAGISGATVSGGSVVVVNSDGQLGAASAGSAVPQSAYCNSADRDCRPFGLHPAWNNQHEV
ncbi:MAG TPA: hypothetical protein VMP11_15815 [Verrucomicrobiae bacterium]|nr:hypothetical protein [Verrucomicrobiae bacterium]